MVVCSTCQKQSEYFDQRDVERLLTCDIYNGAFGDNSLRLHPTNIYYHEELYCKPGSIPKVHLFGSNSETLKRHSYECIAMSAKFFKTRLPDFCHPLLKHIINHFELECSSFQAKQNRQFGIF